MMRRPTLPVLLVALSLYIHGAKPGQVTQTTTVSRPIFTPYPIRAIPFPIPFPTSQRPSASTNDTNCARVNFTDSTGVITSPGFPLLYPHSLNCSYNIVAGGNGSVSLNFLWFDLEDPTRGLCLYDYLTVDCFGNGSNPYRNRKFCGRINWSSALRLSGCTIVIIRFFADTSVNKGGFKIQYNVTASDDAISAENIPSEIPCGETLFNDSNGVVVLPRNPTGYLARINCTYVVSANQSSTIALNTSSLNLAKIRNSFQNCFFEHLEIRCSERHHESLLCGISDTFMLIPLQTQTFDSCRSVILSLRSDIYDFQEEVQIPFTVTAKSYGGRCGNTSFTDETGFIVSPGFPGSYENNLNCTYTIEVGSKASISLEFQRLDLEGYITCTYDWIMIQCLPSITPQSSTYTDRRLCSGSLISPRFSLRGCQTVKIHFVTDGSVVKQGFKILYTTSGNSIDTRCGNTSFTGSSGIITSPSFPNYYLPDLRCTYSIRIPRKESVSFEFLSFELEDPSLSQICIHDMLTIQCMSNNSILERPYTYCGQQNRLKVVFEGCDTVTMTFVTDLSVQKTGFKILYATPANVCGSNIFTGPSGIITSPSFPNYYSHNLRCIYSIRVARKESVSLEFLSFELEDPLTNKTCVHDWLIIQCISNDSIPERPYTNRRLCGQQNNLQFVLEGCDTVTLNFSTDHSVAKAGFNISYVTPARPNVCGNTSFTGLSGIITSPSFPNYYSHNLRCIYSIRVARGEPVSFEFLYFDLEGSLLSGPCIHDWLMIQCMSNGLILQRPYTNRRLCGQQNNVRFVLGGCDTITLNFTTDQSVAKAGFKISYVATSNGNNDTSLFSNASSHTTTMGTTVKDEPITSSFPQSTSGSTSAFASTVTRGIECAEECQKSADGTYCVCPETTSNQFLVTNISRLPDGLTSSSTPSSHSPECETQCKNKSDMKPCECSTTLFTLTTQETKGATEINSFHQSHLSIVFVSLAVVLVVVGLGLGLVFLLRRRRVSKSDHSRLLENEYVNPDTTDSENRGQNSSDSKSASVKYVPLKSLKSDDDREVIFSCQNPSPKVNGNEREHR